MAHGKDSDAAGQVCRMCCGVELFMGARHTTPALIAPAALSQPDLFTHLTKAPTASSTDGPAGQQARAQEAGAVWLLWRC